MDIYKNSKWILSKKQKKLQTEARERYQNHSEEKKEKRRKKAWDRYQNLSEEEKEKKRQYLCSRNNLSEEEEEEKNRWKIWVYEKSLFRAWEIISSYFLRFYKVERDGGHLGTKNILAYKK